MMSANLRAFLALIRWAEGTGGENGYRTIVGGDLFTDFSDHPRTRKSGTFSTGVHWSSDAAGAYQFLSRTWTRCKQACDLPDFSPESQDRAAVWLIEQRGALLDVEMGNLHGALDKCSHEWASLPPSRYGQPTKPYESCERIFVAAGGILAPDKQITQAAGKPASSPVVDASQQAEPPALHEQEFTTMPLPIPALIALGGELLKILPRFGSGSERSTKNIEVTQEIGSALLNVAKEVVPVAANEQEAVEQVLANPKLKEAFIARAAVKWSDIAPLLEYESKEREAARGFAERMTTGDGPAWRQIGSGMLIGALSLIIVVGGGYMFWESLNSPQLDPGQKGLVLGALLTAFATVVGFWFGSSASGRQSGQTVSDIAKSK